MLQEERRDHATNNTRSSNRKPEETLAGEGEIGDYEEQMKSFRKLPEPKVSGLEAHGGNATPRRSSRRSPEPRGAESDVIDTIRILIIAVEITLPIRQSCECAAYAN